MTSHRFLGVAFLCVGVALIVVAASGTDQSTLQSGIDRANFDTSVKPGEDFFQHVNGTWIKKNPIPPEYTRWGVFSKLHDDNLTILREIIEGLAKKTETTDDNSRKLRDLYETAMDEAKLNKEGVAPLADELANVAKVDSADRLIELVGQWQSKGIAPLFNFSVGQDDKMSTRYVVQFWQGGLGLPDKDYYLGKSDYLKGIRDKYHEHVQKMLTLLGDASDKAAAGADTVLRIETQLAEASRTPVELRDPENNYNRKTLKELEEMAPNFPWELYWKSIGVSGITDVVVGQPEFFRRVSEMLTSVAPSDWQTYLRWRLVHSTAPYLSDPLVEENFRFYGKELRGAKELQVRWKRTINSIDNLMGEALGKMYVDKYFAPAAKKRMDELVSNILAAFRERIETRTWMGAESKEKAVAKLDTVMRKIGYPKKWRDYSSLEIGTDSYVQNVLRAEAYEVRYRVSKLGKPVDREEWGMTPPTVNAYYNPSLNEIVFPAGILQPPFFNVNADDAVNYGAIGAVIGHEITHGFDDQGSHYDSEGNLKNWWTREDREKFNAETERLVKEYDVCVALDDLHVNGKLTLGENIADLGGVTIAYAAYQKSLNGKVAPEIDGFTGAQRFYLGYAQAWAGSIRDAELKVMLRTNPHSPDQFRTNVPVSNVQPFYDAFGVKEGNKMYRAPADRVEIW